MNFSLFFLTTGVTYGQDRVFVICKNSYNSRKFFHLIWFFNNFFKQQELTDSSIFIQFLEFSIRSFFMNKATRCRLEAKHRFQCRLVCLACL